VSRVRPPLCARCSGSHTVAGLLKLVVLLLLAEPVLAVKLGVLGRHGRPARRCRRIALRLGIEQLPQTVARRRTLRPSRPGLHPHAAPTAHGQHVRQGVGHSTTQAQAQAQAQAQSQAQAQTRHRRTETGTDSETLAQTMAAMRWAPSARWWLGWLALMVVRVVNSALVQTAAVPDEYWQALEPAHRWVFGYPPGAAPHTRAALRLSVTLSHAP
jgi:hypothetical protein